MSTWLPVENLKKVEFIPEGSYTYDYYLKTKENLAGNRCYNGGWYRSIKDYNPITVSVPENLYIKQDGDKILYSVLFENESCENIIDLHKHSSIEEINTIFGTFKNNNMGEFGGELITPAGKVIRGNFTCLFDWNNNLYAVDLLEHMCCRNFNLYKFISESDYDCIYNSKHTYKSEYTGYDWYEIGIQALYLTNDKIYFSEGGFIKKDSDRNIFKVKSIDKDDNIETIFEIESDISNKNYSFYDTCSLFVNDTTIFVGCDKGLIKICRATKNIKYYTFLSDEDLENIKEANKIKVNNKQEDNICQ